MSDTRQPAVIVMAKRPRPAQSKTRLSPPLTPEQAAALYEAMLRDTLDMVEGLPGVQAVVAVTPPGDAAYFEGLAGADTLLYPVGGPDIGACLQAVLARALDEGHWPALAINSDGPSLPPAYVGRAIASLAQAANPPGVTLGPNPDGGYYLVGVTEPQPALFRDVTWSTPQVWPQTLSNAEHAGLRVEMLPEWYDVDEGGDLVRLRADVESSPPGRLVNTRRFLAQLRDSFL